MLKPETEAKYRRAYDFYKNNNNLSLRDVENEFNMSNGFLSRYCKNKNLILRPNLNRNRKYFFDEEYFSNIDNEEKSYWLGFIVADGCVSEKKSLSIGLSIKDESHLKKFATIFKIPLKNHIKHDKKTLKTYITKEIYINSSKIFSDLCKIGVKPRKSLKMDAEVFSHISDNLMNHFIRGYFDGDGTICITSQGAFRFGFCGTLIFLEKIKKIFIENFDIKTGRIVICGKIHKYLVNSTEDLIKIREFLYRDSSIFLERKKIIFDKCGIPKRIAKRKNTTSKYIHVYLNTNKRWNADICINGKTIYLGVFDSEIEAAKAYNNAAIENGFPLHKLNEIKEEGKAKKAPQLG